MISPWAVQKRRGWKTTRDPCRSVGSTGRYRRASQAPPPT
jgi:hypothetical protein